MDDCSTILREMLFDLQFRLNLFADFFSEVAELTLSAIATGDLELRRKATEKLEDCAETLQLIAADSSLLLTDKSFVFPAPIYQWLWDKTDAEEKIVKFLESLKNISKGMEILLSRHLYSLE